MQDIRDSSDEMVAGRNPVIELLRSERPVNKILMLKTEGGNLKRIVAMAKEKGVPVKDVAREKLDSLSPGLKPSGRYCFCCGL